MKLTFFAGILVVLLFVEGGYGQECPLEYPVEYSSEDGENPPEGYPSQGDIDQALASNITIARELEEAMQSSELPRDYESTSITRAKRGLFDWRCPFRYRYIWRLSGSCYVVWPRPLRQVICLRKDCMHTYPVKGTCRPDCPFTYRRVLVICWNKFWFYLQWYRNITLYQFCDCRLC